MSLNIIFIVSESIEINSPLNPKTFLSNFGVDKIFLLIYDVIKYIYDTIKNGFKYYLLNKKGFKVYFNF